MNRFVYTHRRARKSGHLMFGYASCLVVVGSLCHLLAARAVESYRDAGRAEAQLQARAAAEGAARLLAAADAPRALRIGRCNVTAEELESEPSERRLTLTISQHNATDALNEEFMYQLVYTAAEGEDKWEIVALRRI